MAQTLGFKSAETIISEFKLGPLTNLALDSSASSDFDVRFTLVCRGFLAILVELVQRESAAVVLAER